MLNARQTLDNKKLSTNIRKDLREGSGRKEAKPRDRRRQENWSPSWHEEIVSVKRSQRKREIEH